MVKCTYEIQNDGIIAQGEAPIRGEGDSCFVEIDIPAGDKVFIKISVMRQADNSIAWASSYSGLKSIPVILH